MAFEDDIGGMLFRDILQFTEYPGSPFTGNIINDLIMFLIVPSIFIIVVIYITVGRLFPPEGIFARLRLLLGIGMYLFIIAGGYYRNFALIAGPYFLFLIFIMGLLYFFIEHFTGRRSGGTAAAPGGGAPGAAGLAHYENMPRRDLLIEKDRINAMMRAVDDEIGHAEKGKMETRLSELRQQRATLKAEMHEIETQLNVMRKWQRGSRLPGF
ncbi:MAG: hypothetical protein HYW26_03225 [Candidatus Aenigmarchaeota archaeon]|nr:hypothetical protein [Candidatus Aenigmarchaeota archaeon]